MRCLKIKLIILFFLNFGFFTHFKKLYAQGFGKATAVCHPHNIYQFGQLHIPYFTYYRVTPMTDINDHQALIQEWTRSNGVKTLNGVHPTMLPKECVISAIQACQALGIAAFWMDKTQNRLNATNLADLLRELSNFIYPLSPEHFAPNQNFKPQDFSQFDHLSQSHSQFSIHLTGLTCSQINEYENIKQEQVAMPVITKKGDLANHLNYETLSELSSLELAQHLNQEIEQAQNNGLLILLDEKDVYGAANFAISDQGIDILYPLAKNIRAYQGIAAIRDMVHLVDAAIEKGMVGRYSDWLKLEQQRAEAKPLALSFATTLIIASGSGAGGIMFSSMGSSLDNQVHNNPSLLYHLKARPKIIQRILTREPTRNKVIHYILLLNAANTFFNSKP